MISSSRAAEEIETTLIIWSENPSLVARKIADLTSIANYSLVHPASLKIHDLYLDTRDHKLQTERLALRLREIDASCWITLKGPSQPTEGGVTKRFEIEVRWSREALNNLISELTERGIQILQKHEDFDDANPLDVMRGRGMEVIQDRKTNRQVRRIVPMGENGTSILAELAIDSVVYYFHDQEVCHHEVEIEAKAGKGSTMLNVLVESLIATLGTALRSWSHSKLTTGKAIQNLLYEGALEGMLDNNNNLMPVAYDKIEAFLRSSDI